MKNLSGLFGSQYHNIFLGRQVIVWNQISTIFLFCSLRDQQSTVKSITPSPLPQQLPQSNQPKSTSTIAQLPLQQTSVLKLNLDPSRISLLLLETHKYYYSDRTPSVRPDQWSHHVPSSKPEVTYSSQHFLRRAASWDPNPVPVYILFLPLLSIAFSINTSINFHLLIGLTLFHPSPFCDFLFF